MKGYSVWNTELWILFLKADSKEDWQNQHQDSQLFNCFSCGTCLWENKMCLRGCHITLNFGDSSNINDFPEVHKKTAGTVEVASEYLWIFSTI